MGIEPTTYSLGTCRRALISFMIFVFWHVFGTRFVSCYARLCGYSGCASFAPMIDADCRRVAITSAIRWVAADIDRAPIGERTFGGQFSSANLRRRETPLSIAYLTGLLTKILSLLIARFGIRDASEVVRLPSACRSVRRGLRRAPQASSKHDIVRRWEYGLSGDDPSNHCAWFLCRDLL